MGLRVDAQTYEFKDLASAGTIDPTKVVRTSQRSAAIKGNRIPFAIGHAGEHSAASR